jgi:hypothetical protein
VDGKRKISGINPMLEGLLGWRLMRVFRSQAESASNDE